MFTANTARATPPRPSGQALPELLTRTRVDQLYAHAYGVRMPFGVRSDYLFAGFGEVGKGGCGRDPFGDYGFVEVGGCGRTLVSRMISREWV